MFVELLLVHYIAKLLLDLEIFVLQLTEQN